MTIKLNYTNAADLINAFKQGAKFKVQDNLGTSPVTKIESDASPLGHGLRVYTTTTGVGWGRFRPDGTNSVDRFALLIRDESLGHTEPAPVSDKPLLQRLLQGETFHVPATRETLDSFLFSKGELVVALRGEDGKLRSSENYDHTGKHKWMPARSLVAGPVPPKAPEVPKVPGVRKYSAVELRTSAPEGVYVCMGAGFDAVVLTNGPLRNVLYVCGGEVDILSEKAWESHEFVKSAKRLSVQLG